MFKSSVPTLETLAWKFKTKGRVISSPLVVGDVVYVGSTDGGMYAVNRKDGTQRWRFGTQGPINSSPAFHNGLVYFGSVDGKFYAVSADSGKVKWSFATKGERRFTAPGIHGGIPRTERMPDPFDVFMSSPAIANNIVYFGSGDQSVYALDATTGSLKWSFPTGDVVHASPAVADGVVYIGSWDRNVYALDATTGKEKWRYTTGNDTLIYNQIGIASSAAVVGNVVLVGGRDGKFHAIDRATGKGKWICDNKGGWTIASPAVQNGVVYFPTSDGTRFKALDIETGAPKFDLQTKNVSFSSPALVGDVALFGTSDGYLNAIDTKSGTFLKRFETDGAKENGPRLLNENGQMRGELLYTERTLDGMMMGMMRMMTLGSVLSSPVVADGVVYFGSTDGQLYAVR